MIDAVPKLLAWHSGGVSRYAKGLLHPGHGTPGFSLLLIEIFRDPTDTKMVAAKSVSVEGPADDMGDLIRLALARWSRGEFDQLTRVIEEALLP